jgi:hypothetical protein
MLYRTSIAAPGKIQLHKTITKEQASLSVKDSAPKPACTPTGTEGVRFINSPSVRPVLASSHIFSDDTIQQGEFALIVDPSTPASLIAIGGNKT